MEARVFLAVFLLSTLQFSTPVHGVQSSEQQPTMQSSFEIDYSCPELQNESCSVHPTLHLIEYFSADWCIPCADVDEILSEIELPNTKIILHQASNFDEDYTSASFGHFEGEYRLLYFPSVVYNGMYLFTGSRQALDIEAQLNSTSLPPFSFADIFDGRQLVFNGSDNEYWEIWYTEPMIKNRSDVEFNVVQSVAYLNEEEPRLNISEVFALDEQGSIQVNVWTYGQRGKFLAGSNATLSGFDFLDESFEPDQQSSHQGDQNLPLYVGGILFLLLYPALVSHYRMMRKSTPKGRDEEQ
ncbi:MAG: hypothetical protein O2866_05900 [archaeon]|nr:hypothetical protein [archaeon]MDA0843033.1 hypothetical protein [archaeon]MDA1168398.1 hypothetical protein [archaeon]